MAPADATEVYHRMHEWYDSPECDALRAAWGPYPATPGALQAWPGFVRVTNAFLDYEAAHGRSGEPVAGRPPGRPGAPPLIDHHRGAQPPGNPHGREAESAGFVAVESDRNWRRSACVYAVW